MTITVTSVVRDPDKPNLISVDFTGGPVQKPLLPWQPRWRADRVLIGLRKRDGRPRRVTLIGHSIDPAHPSRRRRWYHLGRRHSQPPRWVRDEVVAVALDRLGAA